MRRTVASSIAASRKARRVRGLLDTSRGTPRPTPRQLAYLRAIAGHRRTTVDMAALLEVSVHAAGAMLRRLERAGWISSSRERRAKIHVLEPHGQALLLLAGARDFAEDMRAQGIHVGIGRPATCATCGLIWPCPAASPVPEPPCLGDAADHPDRALESAR